MQRVNIAKLGRAVGLKGEMKIHLLSDFPEQLKKGAKFYLGNSEIVVDNYDFKKGLIKFVGINTPEEAKKLTNKILSTTIEETKKSCELKENEYFWFDIIGCKVYEDNELLGVVKDIYRYPNSDYLFVLTDKNLIQKQKPKSFLIPFIEKFIKDVSISDKRVEVAGGKDILDASWDLVL